MEQKKPLLQKQPPLPRGYGILMPIFSLHSPYGIGTLGQPAKNFIDFLARAGASVWQVLPLGPTGYGDSPYQCFSAFAGNPYFIDPQELYSRGWLTKREHDAFLRPYTGKVNYGDLFRTRRALLKPAYYGFLKKGDASEQSTYASFLKNNRKWLYDYAVFWALKEQVGYRGRSHFGEWKTKTQAALSFAETHCHESMAQTCFLEFVFWQQWQQLKEYAAKKGLRIMGDVPLYVAEDSADVWAHPDLFCLDENGNPTDVAGVPPDLFSANGQRWGNPLYRWEAHRKTNFDWWKKRVSFLAKSFDLLRLDHFIGMFRYYTIPSDQTTAKHGVWKRGPAGALLSALQEAAETTRFIAEDLGLLTPAVIRFIEQIGFPGMRIVQFAFTGQDNPHLWHRIPSNAVVYTGTHDNQTLVGFLETCSDKTKEQILRYTGVDRPEQLIKQLLRQTMKCQADTVIFPLPDLLGLDDSARLNTPSKTQNNWCWRLSEPLDSALAESLVEMADLYFRTTPKKRRNGYASSIGTPS